MKGTLLIIRGMHAAPRSKFGYLFRVLLASLPHAGLFFPLKTSYTTLWTLYHLARNPEIQEILYQEISSILGEHGDATAGSLAKLSYLKACAKESARQVHVSKWILP